MSHNFLRVLLLAMAMISMASCRTNTPISDYVNPFIGSVTYDEKTTDVHGYGKTIPGVFAPYGLVQLSPDTYTGGDNGSGYSRNHTTIEGFSFTHMSGVGWYGDLGNFLVMPSVGRMYTNKGDVSDPDHGYRSRFSNATESASAGYYSVFLDDYKITVELSAARRAGIIRFTFPESDSSRIQIDLARRIGGTSSEQFLKVEDRQTLSGWMHCTPEGGGWGNGEGEAEYTVYFWCQFDKPFKDYGLWSAEIPADQRRLREDVNSELYQSLISNAAIHNEIDSFQGKHLGFFTNFKTKENEEVICKTGISFVSTEGARNNLENDIPHWDLDRVVSETKKLWDESLGVIRIEGGSDAEKEIFYSALYRTMLDPRDISDHDGCYVGIDNKVHQAEDYTYRTIFSGWDVFRSQFPLQTIVNPGLVSDEINSLIEMADLSGKKYFPRWELLNAYSGCMLGNPAVSIVVDAYNKGIRNYDVEKAFEFSKNSVDVFGNEPLGYTPDQISKTLEYAYFDWCVGIFADSLGEAELANEYLRRSQNYKNIWDDEVMWFRAKDAQGVWNKWLGKTVHGQGCAESNPYQQGWFVPHDLSGLAELMLGKQTMQDELIHFFDNTPDSFNWNDYYNHANEPVHHIPFIFNEMGLPHLTQKWTRRICANAYGNDEYGLCGNEDVGQMSAWYVLAAMGIHPVCPGDNKYQITSPVFSKIEIQLNKDYYPGKKFNIIALNHSRENVYIKSFKLNGKELNRTWISHDEIVNGGTLEMLMSPEPFLLQ